MTKTIAGLFGAVGLLAVGGQAHAGIVTPGYSAATDAQVHNIDWHRDYHRDYHHRDYHHHSLVKIGPVRIR